MVSSAYEGASATSERGVMLEIGHALEEGRVDAVVHLLLLLLGDPQHTRARTKREQTLKLAISKLETLLEMQHNAVQLAPGLRTPDPQECCLSYPQLQMFALHKLQPASTAYNIVRAVEIANVPLDEQALNWTCGALMMKHDVLRTCFDSDLYGQPRQRVLPLEHFIDNAGDNTVLSVLDCRDCSSAEGEPETLSALWIAEKTTKPFDLSCDAPIRVYVIPSKSSSMPWTLVVALHHIVTDRESCELFWSDFAQIYHTFLVERVDDDDSNKTTVLERLKSYELTNRVSYCDYARWQRDHLDSGLLSTSLQYWIQVFSDGDIPVLELPLDKEIRSLASIQVDSKAGVVVFQSSHKLHEMFASYCKAHGSSMFIGLLAVFQLLLSRLACCDDIVIGCPTSGRGGHKILTSVMGYFVNTLPFRIQSRHDEGFEKFLSYVREVVLSGLSHMEIPLQKILEHVSVQRTGQQQSNPLYQVMFAWENSSSPRSSLASSNDPQCPQMEFKDIELSPGSAKFDLMLAMRCKVNEDGETVLEGSMEYPMELFHRETVVRFTGYFLNLLDQVMQDPHKQLRNIDMLPQCEQRVLLNEWGAPAVHHSSAGDSVTPKDLDFLDECLHQQVLVTPENEALRFEGTEWTYQDLWTQATRFRDALRNLSPCGVVSGDRVGLFLDRGLENIAAMVSILQLKAVFVPLDTDFPPDRIKYMIKDSKVQVIISQRRHAQKLSDLLENGRGTSINNPMVKLLYCEDLGTHIPSQHQEGMDNSIPLGSSHKTPHGTVAYILYTSGSTGNPKGVIVTHANILTTLRWTIREYQVSSASIFLQSTPSTLDGSLTQLFAPLLAGGSAVITKKNGLHDLNYMRELLIGHKISVCVFVPSYFAMLMDFMDEFPAYVQYVVLAGEAFPTALATKFYDKNAKCCSVTNKKVSPTCLVNEYGPTEASVTSTFCRLPCEIALGRDEIMLKLQSVPIGKPIDNHFVRVLDAQKRLVPVNVPGELYVGGCGVAKGYWDRPELTSKSFEELHHEVHGSMRWYKTGDRVKWLHNGQLLFLGRTDSQMKLRGMRVELQEIRNAILGHPWVKDAEALVVKQQRIVGFVLLNDKSIQQCGKGETTTQDQSGVAKELREYLGNLLPVHMVPHDLRVVESWPRTPNGKLDTRALADVASTIPSSGGRSSASAAKPNSATQDLERSQESTSISIRITTDILKQAWAEALDVTDHELLLSAAFFELGGNSLTAIRVISLVKAHGITLKLEWFFRCKTLVEMARLASSSLFDGTAGGGSSALMSSSSSLVPLNWKQQPSSSVPSSA